MGDCHHSTSLDLLRYTIVLPPLAHFVTPSILATVQMNPHHHMPTRHRLVEIFHLLHAKTHLPRFPSMMNYYNISSSHFQWIARYQAQWTLLKILASYQSLSDNITSRLLCSSMDLILSNCPNMDTILLISLSAHCLLQASDAVTSQYACYL